MSRIYATTQDGKRFLVALECDKCGITIKPNLKINKSQWIKSGVYFSPGNSRNMEWIYCSLCIDKT